MYIDVFTFVFQRKKDAALQAALIEALREPATQAIDPLDGFLVRLGEVCENCYTETEPD